METGRLSGKLHSDENWIGMPNSGARELIITVWSWAIDHDKDDGIVPWGVMRALSSLLGHTEDEHAETPDEVIDDLILWGWVEKTDKEPRPDLRLLHWDDQAAAIKRVRERREKERERYERRKAAKDGT